MKILFITTLYAECIMKFDAMYSAKDYSYKQLKDIIKDSFLAYYVSGYVSAFKNMNIEAEYIIYNSKVLQGAWEKENIRASSNFSKEEILISQVKDYGETIVFWDMVDSDLLNYLKMECSNVRAFVGWTGSAVAVSKQWKELDVVFSCAQESVDYLVGEGANAEQIHHAFPIDVLPNLIKKHSSNLVSFVGSVIRGKDFHLHRENMLIELSKIVPLSIYSPSYAIGFIELLMVLGKRFAYSVLNNSGVGKAYFYGKTKPVLPVNIKLKKYLSAPVFGIDMFNALYNSEIVLNIHADSSPLYASNMRLFEATGVGSCLLTDKKQNISDLFEVDKEIIVYESVDDCIEKIRWLLSHKAISKSIAEAGQKRCLRDHTYDNRVPLFIQKVEKYL